MTIPDVMLNDETKASCDYVNCLTKYGDAEPSVPTLGRGRGKGCMIKGGLEVNVDKKRMKVDAPNKRHTITVADNILEDPKQALDLDVIKREVNNKVDEGYNDQVKLKLKVVDTVTLDAQLLLDLKKGSRASQEAHILK
nr:hypothetical protein [Tanacetum cinerariifolium]